MDCDHCGRDLYKYGYRSGNPLDGYEVPTTLCQDCNRAQLRREGLGYYARRDEVNEAIAKWFWRGIGIMFMIVFGV